MIDTQLLPTPLPTTECKGCGDASNGNTWWRVVLLPFQPTPRRTDLWFCLHCGETLGLLLLGKELVKGKVSGSA